MTPSLRRPPLALALALALLAGPTVSATGVSHAGEAGSFAELPPVLPGVDAFRSHPDLLGVEVESAAYDRVRVAYEQTADELTSAFEAGIAAERNATLLMAARERELGVLSAATARRDSFATVATQLTDAIGEIAIEVFVGIDTSAVLTALEDPAATNAQQRERVLTATVVDALVAERNAALENVERAERSRITASNAIADIDRRLAATNQTLAASAATTDELAPTLAERREDVETERALADVTGTDMTLIALDAYYRAAETMAALDPGCGVEWWAIAGISKVEGRHGTFGGSTLTASGTVDPPIIGIPLTGANGTARIDDSDGGAFDGDPTVDRAVGPMQFIPDTWRRFAADGNGDGEESPQNIYDATLAAGAYLCRSGRNLDTDPALRVAYFSYNRSETYVASVLDHARGYQAVLTIGDGGA